MNDEYDFDYSKAKPNRFASDDLRAEYDVRTMRGVVRGKRTESAARVAEISFDLVLEEEMAFVEGAFRLPGGEWQVLIVSKRDVPEVEVTPQVWESGVEGVVVRYPRNRTLNEDAVKALLSATFAVRRWQVVRGPDSMTLR